MSVPRRRDEEALWAAVVAGESPREAGHRLHIKPGRVEYLCLKWAGKGIYNYGVAHDLGWVEKWGVVRIVASMDEWESMPTGKRQAVLQAATNAAKVEAVQQVKVDPTTAEVSLAREVLAVSLPDAGAAANTPCLAIRVQFTPTLDSRFPSHTEREGANA